MPMMRSQFYHKLAGLIMQNGDELARLKSMSMGKYVSYPLSPKCHVPKPIFNVNFHNGNRRLV
jgi:hypothetical protein